ncbi:MAG: DUF58 domain-containing protein [Oscillospiraceae bacterium]|nr:DUF58 domain-containing protein [Oscillospiraceae bacterium]
MLPFFFILIALGIILEIISLRRDPGIVKLEYDLSARCVEPGAPIHVHATVTNGSRVPISYLAVNETYPMEATLPKGIMYRNRLDSLQIKKICRVKGRQKKKLTMEASVEKRGVYTFNSDSIEFGDFLGFREVSKTTLQKREIVVYPKRDGPPDITDALGRFLGDVAARRFLIRDPILTAGCREYTGREPMKEIHWLQSAHRGELMVREFDYTRQISACVVLAVDSIDQAEFTDLDECCSAARLVCETLNNAGASVSFFTNSMLTRISGRNIWQCEYSPGHGDELLEGLGRVSGTACRPLAELLEFSMRKSDYDAAFVLIVPSGDLSGEEAASMLRDKTGREVLLVRAGRGALSDTTAQDAV